MRWEIGRLACLAVGRDEGAPFMPGVLARKQRPGKPKSRDPCSNRLEPWLSVFRLIVS
jgi:hypothetical protein